jgi:hypothetical protein
MANPSVGPFIEVYPHDTGGLVKNACDAARWRHEIDPEHLTPMIRTKDQDYYTFEPALRYNGTACMPIRWFKRQGNFWADAWSMVVAQDDCSAWEVCEWETVEVAASELLLAFPRFQATHMFYGLPNPAHVKGQY